MKKIYVAILVLLSLSIALSALDPVYHTYAEIVAELDSLQNEYPDFVYVEQIGMSNGGAEQDPQPIYAVKLSDNASVYEDEPKVMFAGQCHAEEVLGIEVVMYMINDIIEHRMVSPWQIWLNNIEIWFVPTYNPDGLNVVTSGQDEAFRKNVIDANDNGVFDFIVGPGRDLDGTDPNRNYDFNWIHGDPFMCPDGEEIYDYYRGPYAFSSGGTKAIRDLAEDNHFIYSINYHSSRTGNFSEKLYYSFEWEGEKQSVDFAMTSQAGINVANRIEVEPPQSGHYAPYPSQGRKGSAHDWFYHAHGTIQLLIECGTSNLQPGADLVLDTAVRNAVGAYWMLGRVLGYQTEDRSMLTGHVVDAITGDPLEAEVQVLERHAAYFEPRLSDPQFGRFFRPLEQNTYTVKFIKKGYEDLTIENVVVNNSGWTDLDNAPYDGINMQPLETVNIIGNVSCQGEPVIAKVIVEDVEDDIALTDASGDFDLQVFEGDRMITVLSDYCVPIKYIETFTPGDMILNIELEPAVDVFTENWESDMGNWNVVGPWGIVVDDDNNHFADDSPGEFYEDACNVYINNILPINLHGVSNDAMLVLDHRYYVESGVDFAILEYSYNGTDWEELKRYTGVQKTWVKDLISLEDHINNNFYLRFRVAADETLNDPGWKINNIAIYASIGADSDESELIPETTTLIGNYPNPFNPETEIAFTLGQDDNVELKIFNLKGQLVKTLVDANLTAGIYKYRWQGTDDKNQPVSSGIYFYQFNSSNLNTAKKMILMK